MKPENPSNLNIMTPEFRVAYPSVFKPKKNDMNGKDEFSVVALFKKGEDLSALKASVKAVLEKKFGKDQSAWPASLKSPFRDQGERFKLVDGKKVLNAGHEAGAIFVNFKSKDRPGVVDQNVQEIIVESDFYSGCYARATVRPYYYDKNGNRGVAFGLQNLQKVRDGEPLGGRVSPQFDFAPIGGVEESAATGASATSMFD